MFRSLIYYIFCLFNLSFLEAVGSDCPKLPFAIESSLVQQIQSIVIGNTDGIKRSSTLVEAHLSATEDLELGGLEVTSKDVEIPSVFMQPKCKVLITGQILVLNPTSTYSMPEIGQYRVVIPAPIRVRQIREAYLHPKKILTLLHKRRVPLLRKRTSMPLQRSLLQGRCGYLR